MRTNNPLHLNTLKEAAINKFFLSVTMLFALTACVTREFPPRIPEGILPGLTLLTPGVNASYRHPSWSPDGQLLVYDHANLFVPGGRDPFPYNAEIYILDLSTGHTQQLTDNEVADVQPEWSPDGSQIVFVRSKDDMNTFGGGPQRLMLISPHGSGEKLLFECPQGCEEPTWSPDNQWVIFAMEDHLWIIRVDGTDLYPITSQLAEIG
nr:PD40 domain-containing protein [bacterium]